MEKQTIKLGSGKLYCLDFTGEIPEIEEIKKEENILGYIKGGASLEYKPTSYTAKDDLGLVEKTVLTDEEATLKSGICTWNAETLNHLCSTGRITEDTSKGVRTVKIGGINNDVNKSYLLCFYNKDAIDGDSWIIIVGKNVAGFTLTYAKENETVIDAEFKAQPHDGEGTLIRFCEQIDISPAPQGNI